MMSSEQKGYPPVVIVGAGPTGLALAVELGTRSVPCLVVERDPERGFAPRAKTTHVRTRELMRRWGIADDLARAAPFGIDYPSNIFFVTRLNGHQIARFDNALNTAPVRDERYSEHAQWVPQYKLEAVLRDKAESLPSVDFRYGVEFVGVEQDADGIRVQLLSVETGDTERIDATYLIGADGARSAVRSSIGAKMEGRYGLSRNYNIIFEAPGLAEAHPHGPGIMYWLCNSDAPGVIGPMDSGDRWYFGVMGLPPDVTLSDEAALSLIKRSTGIDLPYHIVDSDVWIASRLIADGYQKGNIFLAGDACHLHPPFGGFGMNMGIADAVDLGWKIAAVIQGWGGPALLDSYEIERRPAHEMVMNEAEANHAVLSQHLLRDGLEDDGPIGAAARSEVAEIVRREKEREFYALGVVLGLPYHGSPVIEYDGSEAEWTMSHDYVPSASPGSLAPHAWLNDGRSLYDLFGEAFTVLAFTAAQKDALTMARDEAERTNTPLTVVTLIDPRLAALYEAPLALIRPDQFVAWRGDRWPTEGLLLKVTGRAPAHIG